MLILLDRRMLMAGALSAPFAAHAARPAHASWRLLQTEPYKGKQDDISFVSPDLGWYGNGAGKLYRTTDGGDHWEKVWEQPGTFIRALGFVDARNGFLGNVGTDYYPNVSDTQPLYRTRDGGLSWAPVTAEGVGIVKGICGIDILHRRRVFQGEARDVPVIHAAGRVGGPATMLRSVDAGETWQVMDLSAHAGMILDVKFFDERNGLVCAATSDDLEKANALILRTADGGKSWSRAYQSTRPLENCWKMSFPTRRTGYATVQSYADGASKRVIVKTVDGGVSWREVPLVDHPKAQEFGIGFFDEKWGFVGTAIGGFETRDGGRSWMPIEFGRAVNKIRIVRDGARARAFAIGVTVARLDLG